MADTLTEHLRLAASLLASQGNPTDEATRKESLSLAKQILLALENPVDTIKHYGREVRREKPPTQVNPQQMSLQVGIDLQLFKILASSTSPLTSVDLAKQCGAEELLVVRVMRVLTAAGIVGEVGPQIYKATAVTQALAQKPSLESMVYMVTEGPARIHAQLPQYFREIGYKCPTDPLDCPFQWTFKTSQDYFEWVASDSRRAEHFAASMKNMSKAGTPWYEFFPVQEGLLDGADEDSPLIVDVGGGEGHDLKLFLEHYPQASGKVVLQDRPNIIEMLRERSLDGVELMSHDFFEKQPVAGAKAYYTHRVLHDWADPKAAIILKHLRDVMKPGYSRLLINETVLPETGCSAFEAAGDMNMMVILGGMKRTQSQWKQIVESISGLEIVKTWMSDDENCLDGVIEVVRRD